MPVVLRKVIEMVEILVLLALEHTLILGPTFGPQKIIPTIPHLG